MNNKANFTCLALSPAGKVPFYGQNNYHIYNESRWSGIGYYCDESKVTKAVLGVGNRHTMECAANRWNRTYDKNGIDAPDGWRWGTLCIHHLYMGGEEILCDIDFVGFKTSHPDIYVGGYIIDRERYISDLQILDINGNLWDFSLPIKNKGYDFSHIYANESMTTNSNKVGGWDKYPRINVRLYTNRDRNRFEPFIQSIKR